MKKLPTMLLEDATSTHKDNPLHTVAPTSTNPTMKERSNIHKLALQDDALKREETETPLSPNMDP
jgi:hypothetical protein